MKSKLQTRTRVASVSYLAGWEVAFTNFEQWSKDYDRIFGKLSPRKIKE